ncbi:amidohydrolase family protein [Dongia sp.]|uniref:amidohydrolase family protein n=1 Tax=Dongia sp. TaxID=1977262 RepID=UPI0035B04B6B
MRDTLFISDLRDARGAAIDLLIAGGRIAAVTPAGSTSSDMPGLAGKGRLLLPALVEAHCHFDKTLWGQPWRANSAGLTLRDYIDNERRILRGLDVPIAARAGRLIEHCIAKGSLHFRCHVDVDPEFGVSHVEAMLALRETYRDVITMEFVAFPQTGLLIRPGTLGVMEAALKLGVEHVGGLDPAGIDNDPIRHLEAIFDLAGRYGRGIDIHLHDKSELGLWQIARIADFTEERRYQGKVVISHAYCLGQAGPERLARIAARLAETGISIMTTAPADGPAPPVADLRAAGVNICMGSDGIRDAWSPFGTGDMLERALFLCLRFDWAKDEELAMAFDCVTTGGARVLGLASYGIEVGAPANLILLPAENIGDAIARRPQDRLVIAQGRIVAEDGRYLAAG